MKDENGEMKLGTAWVSAVFGNGSDGGVFSRMMESKKNKYDREYDDIYEQIYGNDEDQKRKELNVDAYNREIQKISKWESWTDEAVTIWQGKNQETKKFNDFEAADQAKIIDNINNMGSLQNLAKGQTIQKEVTTKWGVYELKEEWWVFKYVKKEPNNQQSSNQQPSNQQQ